MGAQAKTDEILNSLYERVQAEAGELLGVDISFGQPINRPWSKKRFIESLAGKHVLARLTDSMNLHDDAFLAIAIKGAIRIGGTLLMLPEAELDEAVSREEYTEEVEDAFGEISHVVTTGLNEVLEESGFGTYLFRVNGQEVITPLVVEIEGDTPFPNSDWFFSSSALEVDGHYLGDVHLVLPPSLVGFSHDITFDSIEGAGSDGLLEGVSDDDHSVSEGQDGLADPESGSISFEYSGGIEEIFGSLSQSLRQSFSGKSEKEVDLACRNGQRVTKEQFFQGDLEADLLLSDLEMFGDIDSVAYFFQGVDSAIVTGGALDLLPPLEFDSELGNGELVFGLDAACSVITEATARALTAEFGKGRGKDVEFVAGGVRTVQLGEVEIDSHLPIPDQSFYVVDVEVLVEGGVAGEFTLLFPVELFEAEGYENTASVTAEPVDLGDSGDLAEVGAQTEVLILGDEGDEADRIAQMAEGLGLLANQLTFKDDIRNVLSAKLKIVYIVAEDFNEQAFGMAIKVHSYGQMPIIAVGGIWTRSKVIKAVRYGIRDIVMTPATDEEHQSILEKLLAPVAA